MQAVKTLVRRAFRVWLYSLVEVDTHVRSTSKAIQETWDRLSAAESDDNRLTAFEVKLCLILQDNQDVLVDAYQFDKKSNNIGICLKLLESIEDQIKPIILEYKEAEKSACDQVQLFTELLDEQTREMYATMHLKVQEKRMALEYGQRKADADSLKLRTSTDQRRSYLRRQLTLWNVEWDTFVEQCRPMWKFVDLNPELFGSSSSIGIPADDSSPERYLEIYSKYSPRVVAIIREHLDDSADSLAYKTAIESKPPDLRLYKELLDDLDKLPSTTTAGESKETGYDATKLAKFLDESNGLIDKAYRTWESELTKSEKVIETALLDVWKPFDQKLEASSKKLNSLCSDVVTRASKALEDPRVELMRHKETMENVLQLLKGISITALFTDAKKMDSMAQVNFMNKYLETAHGWLNL